MKPHTPAATNAANSFDVDHKANHCHAKCALAACQPGRGKVSAEMLIAVDVLCTFRRGAYHCAALSLSLLSLYLSSRNEISARDYDAVKMRRNSLPFIYMKLSFAITYYTRIIYICIIGTHRV